MVSRTCRRDRSNSSTRSSRSSRWIDWLSGGCAMPEHLGRPPEVQLPRDHHEVPQVSEQIHPRTLRPRPTPAILQLLPGHSG